MENPDTRMRETPTAIAAERSIAISGGGQYHKRQLYNTSLSLHHRGAEQDYSEAAGGNIQA